MGMYTEIFITCRIKKDTPQNVISVLEYLFKNRNSGVPGKCPDHEFFKCDRWMGIGASASYYFVPYALSDFRRDGIDDSEDGQYFLTSRSDLKNYDGEINKFFDWIMPYIDEPQGQFIGYSRYEEDDMPTIVVKAAE